MGLLQGASTPGFNLRCGGGFLFQASDLSAPLKTIAAGDRDVIGERLFLQEPSPAAKCSLQEHHQQENTQQQAINHEHCHVHFLYPCQEQPDAQVRENGG